MKARLHSDLQFAVARIAVDKRADGATILRSPQALGPFPRATGEWLVSWAGKAPERTFLAEREGESWRKVTYAQALDSARRVGEALLVRGLSAARPVAILSDNSVDHALLALGAMHAGIPVAPISPAYSLMSQDHLKLKGIVALLQPGLIYAADGERFAGALAALDLQDVEVVVSANPPAGVVASDFSALASWKNPNSALSSTMARMAAVLVHSPMAPEITAAAIRIHTTTSPN